MVPVRDPGLELGFDDGLDPESDRPRERTEEVAETGVYGWSGCSAVGDELNDNAGIDDSLSFPMEKRRLFFFMVNKGK